MIKAGVAPGRRVVTGGAGRRNTRLRVVRICSSLIILQVTAGAIGGRQVVVSVGVALRALQRCVGAGERKSNQAVVEGCRDPRRCVVA